MTQTVLRAEQLEHVLIDGSEITINSGTATIISTAQYFTIDTEGDAASDNLDTFAGASDGQWFVVRAEHTDRTVVLRHGEDNIVTQDGENIDLDDTNKACLIHRKGSTYYVLAQPVAPAGDKIGTVFSSSVYTTGSSEAYADRNTTRLSDGGNTKSYYTLAVPTDFSSLISCVLLLCVDSTDANYEYDLYVSYGADGEAINVHTANSTNQAYSGVADVQDQIDLSGLLGSLAAGDVIGFQFKESAGTAAGTPHFYLMGVLLIYERS